MKFELKLDEKLSDALIQKVLSDIRLYKNDLGSEDFESHQLSYISEFVEESLLFLKNEKSQFKIVIGDYCIGDFINEIETWLCDLSETYECINNKEDFGWLFPLMYSSTPYINFKYHNEGYIISFMYEHLNKKKEIEDFISLQDIKFLIEQSRRRYCEYIKANFGNYLDDYLQLLDLSFE